MSIVRREGSWMSIFTVSKLQLSGSGVHTFSGLTVSGVTFSSYCVPGRAGADPDGPAQN